VSQPWLRHPPEYLKESKRMSDAITLMPSTEQLTRPTVSTLGRDVALLAWDVPAVARFTSPGLTAEGGSVAPLASLRLPLDNGGSRLVWVLRMPQDGGLRAVLSTGPLGLRAEVNINASDDIPSLEVTELLRGVHRSGRVALVSSLFNVWAPLFRLQHSRTFIRVLRDLLAHLAPAPGNAVVVAQAAHDLVLLRTTLSAGFGKVDAVYSLGDDGPVRIAAIPHRVPMGDSSREVVHLLADRRAVPTANGLMLLIGPQGVSVRRLAAQGHALPSIERWFREQAQTAPALREHLLVDLAERSEAGRAIALEAQLRAPLKPQFVAGIGSAPAAEIVTALSTPSGTLVTGWYKDPLGLVAGIEAVGAQDGSHDLTSNLFRFPVEVTGPTKDERQAAMGFAVLAPPVGNGMPILQPRFRLRLQSGGYHALVPRPQAADPVAARAAALRAVPPQRVDERLLSNVLAPVIADLHAQASSLVGAPTVQRIGSPVSRPKASVVIPLYKELSFLRFQIAAFAADPWFRANAELIYVLDSPEQAQEVSHLLNGLHLVYALPMTLVIMERNGGYAKANNVGVSVARGEYLALVNSDVIPTAAGWLEGLASKLSGRRRIGAVGPKLLFEDGSIQHAGMFFGRDHHGRWLNQHYHKGMPRDYGSACVERVVPAVTGACLITTRSLFEAVGGFTEDYVIGDYEDSDLCLKITMADRRIAYAPDVELYHLERKSMSLNTEYMRGIAWQYNCALHTERWGQLMTSLMQADARQRKARI
jgi:GT2 family glycosyltransferase